MKGSKEWRIAEKDRGHCWAILATYPGDEIPCRFALCSEDLKTDADIQIISVFS